MEGHRVLVTGAGGQLGHALFQTVSTLDEATGARFLFASKNDLNVTDYEAVSSYISEHCVSIIINCAAYTNVDKAEDEPQKALLINAEAPKILALVGREQNLPIFHLSTDYVFGGGNQGLNESVNIPYTEEVTPAPLGVYGATKLKGEEYIQKIAPRFIILRTGWLYSAYGKNFLKTMLHKMSSEEQIKVVSDQIGTPTFAGDLAEAILKIIVQISDNKEDRSLCEIYNYSNEGSCSWYDFAEAIEEISREYRGGRRCLVKPCLTADYPTKATRPAYSVLDKTKIKNTFGVAIPPWRESLKKCIDSIYQN